MHDGAESALLLEVGKNAHRWHQPKMMPDSDHDAGALAGIECRLRIGLAERKRLFAIDMLAGSRNGFDLRTMLGVRGRKDHGLDRLVTQHFIERGAECDLMFGGKITHRFRLERDAAYEMQPRADFTSVLPHQPRPTIAVFSICDCCLYAAAGAPGCFNG